MNTPEVNRSADDEITEQLRVVVAAALPPTVTRFPDDEFTRAWRTLAILFSRRLWLGLLATGLAVVLEIWTDSLIWLNPTDEPWSDWLCSHPLTPLFALLLGGCGVLLSMGWAIAETPNRNGA